MKKTMLVLSVLTSSAILSDGGAIGVQFGGITFGLGGSSNGPIIGVGRSPNNGLPFSAVIVPGDSCCESNCNNCNSCDTCN